MKAKKDYVNVTCRLDKEAADKVNKIAELTDLSKTAIIERAIKVYYEKFKETGKV